MSNDISTLLLEKDQLVKENRELQDKNSCLTRDNEMLAEQLSLQQNHIMELQTEKENLLVIISEIGECYF